MGYSESKAKNPFLDAARRGAEKIQLDRFAQSLGPLRAMDPAIRNVTQTFGFRKIMSGARLFSARARFDAATKI
jgi:hypothetical protein